MANHGIFIVEESTVLTIPVTGNSSIPVVVGAAPVNMTDDPASKVNTPILANSATEAMAALGYSKNFNMGGFTLCQMMYATANIYQVSPVVYINVLDPAKHKKDLPEAQYQVNQMQAIIDKEGVITTSLTVKDQDSTPLTKDKDFTLEFNADGFAVITLIKGQAGESATTLTVSGEVVAPEKITKDEIIGAYDPSTGKETGLQVIRQVYPKLQVVPGLLLAPSWSFQPEVGIALSAKAALINGVFRAMALLDLDTDKTKTYTDTKKAKEDSGFTSAFCAVLWPMDKVGDVILEKSVTVAAMIAYQDAANDNVPYLYPSNKMLGVTGQCFWDGTEIMLDQEQGSAVNAYGVITAINAGGWKLWGNYTGAYPTSTDPKDIWLAVRRMFNWHGNTFIQTYQSRVDDPMNHKLVESIVDSENIRCGAYAPDKWAGATIEYRAEDNPTTSIIAGQMTFRQRIAPYTPAQEITNILSYDLDMLTASLTGGE
nr:phage tail sheath family protein [uncultured Dysosmobacter sp.]